MATDVLLEALRRFCRKYDNGSALYNGSGETISNELDELCALATESAAVSVTYPSMNESTAGAVSVPRLSDEEIARLAAAILDAPLRDPTGAKAEVPQAPAGGGA